MIIKPLGQSGYVLKTAKTEIIIDPYLSDIVNRVAGRARLLPCPVDPKTISADAVVCTHNHLDHLDPDAIREMPDDLFFITTEDGVSELETLGKHKHLALHTGETVTVGDFEITAVFANHTVEAFGIIVKAEGKTLYFSGDTLFDEKLFEISKFHPDFTFICINGKLGNMTVSEAVTVAEKIGAAVNIPNHYDMFASNSENPLLFTENIKGGKIFEFGKEYEI